MPASSAARVRPIASQRRHVTRQPRHRLRRGLVLVMVGLLTFFGAGSVFAYQQIQGGMSTHNLDDILAGGDRPAEQDAPDDELDGRPVNIMVMGSDARAEDDGDYAAVSGMRSDTNVLMHISADRTRVDVVSIPRDLLVDVPACPLPDGSQTTPMAAGVDDNGTRFNAAFAYGGQGGDVAHAAACTILTVEQMTGLYIDDFAVMDFDGFRGMIDALGGVEMCFEQDIEAPKAHLSLSEGCHELDGDTALGVARARVGVDDGSDISRIDRQQDLFNAIAAEVFDSNLVTDTPALFRFLQATTSSLTTSDRIGNLTTMGGLAYSLRNLDTADVNFVTVPFDWAGNVVVQNAEGEPLWESLRSDQPMVLPAEEQHETDEVTDTGEDDDQDQLEAEGNSG